MANVTKGNPLYVDTEGVISTIPLTIKKIVLKPSATGDAATFTYWVESDTPLTTYGTRADKTVTITASSGTFASTTNFETDSIDVDQIFKVVKSSTGNNIGTWQIASNADDNTITVDKPATVLGGTPTVTDGTSSILTWYVWDTRYLLTIKGSGVTNDTGLVQVDFPNGGFRVPNLAMNTLSTSAVLYIYLE